MKRLLLIVLTFVLGAAAFAQPLRKVAPMNRAGKEDIILTQPEGELHTYMRSGGCTDVLYGSLFASDLTQDGFARVVISPDKKTAYFQNIISRAATGAWVRGSIKDNKIEIPYGQLYYWFEAPVNPTTGKEEAPYGMKIAGIKMKGSHNSYDVEKSGKAVFRIDGDWSRLVLENTSADLSTDTIVGLGLIYTDAYDGEWSYYMDYETVYTEITDKPVTPPEGLVTKRYSITHGIYGHFVEVGFERNDVYVRGVSEDYVPSAWLKGTLDEATNKITFPTQMAGSYQTSLYFFQGADIKKVDDYYGGRYTYTFDPENLDIVFDYDPETRSFSCSDRGLIVNDSRDSLKTYERFPKPVFRPYSEKAATPAAPAILELDNRYWQWGYNLSTLAISVPCMDEDGDFIDPSKLFYALYIDEDEPYLLYQDEYVGLPFDEVEEIPYLFTNNKDIYPKSVGLYLYQNGFERIGIKSIYYGGDERHETLIYYNDGTTSGGGNEDAIAQIENGKKGSQDIVYDLSGRQVLKSSNGQIKKGLYIINGKKVVK